MQCLTTDLMCQACRVFLSQAYPSEAAIPVKKRHLLALPGGLLVLDHMGADPAMRECCQVVSGKDGEVRALLVRIGCGHYPHLKLKAQIIDEDRGGGSWLFSVDTHDAYSAASFLPPPDNPDASAWMKMQTANSALKVKIEAAWEKAGLLTFNGLLRRDLPPVGPSLS